MHNHGAHLRTPRLKELENVAPWQADAESTPIEALAVRFCGPGAIMEVWRPVRSIVTPVLLPEQPGFSDVIAPYVRLDTVTAKLLGFVTVIVTGVVGPPGYSRTAEAVGKETALMVTV